MPFDPLPVPKYPDVPLAPGVPAVQRLASFVATDALPVLALADASGLFGSFAPKPWGIFTAAGQPAFDIDAVVGVELKHESQVPNYNMEKGAFASYNKVQLPYDARVTMTVGGSDARRGALISAVVAAMQSLTLYTVTMPEFFYKNANIVHYDFARRSTGNSATGVGLLTVAVWLQEIRQSASTTFTDTSDENHGQGPVNTPQSTANQILFPKQPSGASPNNVGPVQTQSPSDYSSIFGPTSTPQFFGPTKTGFFDQPITGS